MAGAGVAARVAEEAASGGTEAAVGSTAVACRPTVLLRPLPWLRPFTCVEFCKRLVRCARTDVITPYQLFCELMRVGGRA